MIHLGDITKIHNAPFVDCITFGSPCQDLSIAGKRAGLDGERSGLFMDAVRIIKEMREQSGGVYPTFAIWENVPGAFSSNGGKDFRAVLEELASAAEGRRVTVPEPPKGKWKKAGYIEGDRWSIAWRTFDAQFWGVPQRRKRIALVVDFGGQRAGEILFERTSVRGDSEPSIPPWQGVARNPAHGAAGHDRVAEGAIPINTMIATRHRQLGRGTGFGVGEAGDPQFTITAGHEHAVAYTMKIRSGCEGGGKGPLIQDDLSATLRTDGGLSAMPTVLCRAHGQANAETLEDCSPSLTCNHEQPIVFDARGNGDGKVVPTITGDHESRVTDYTAVVVHKILRWIVRRMTPVECERLQGYPDGWTDIGDWTDTKGKRHKPADGPRYKDLGNSIALPQWWWITCKMAAYLPACATLGSLFDGIGGFPLVWETRHGAGTALWASEIEEFPIAVTKMRFSERKL